MTTKLGTINGTIYWLEGGSIVYFSPEGYRHWADLQTLAFLLFGRMNKLEGRLETINDLAATYAVCDGECVDCRLLRGIGKLARGEEDGR